MGGDMWAAGINYGNVGYFSTLQCIGSNSMSVGNVMMMIDS